MMRSHRLIPALLLCAAAAPGQDVPDIMNYQGMLVNLGGTPVSTDTYTMEFRVYDQLSGGSLVWGPQIFDGVPGAGHSDRVPVVDGAFSVILGPEDTVGRSLLGAFSGPERFLQITVELPAKAMEILSPRQQILSTPYALNAFTAKEAVFAATADTAQSAAEESINSAMIANGTIQPEDLAEGATLVEILDNDGPGSGLDADVLDGKQAADFWQLGGNTGTDPESDVLGTLDYTPMVFVVHGQQALRFFPAPSPTLVGGFATNSAPEGLSGGVIAGGGAELLPNKLGGDFCTIGGGYANLAGPGSWTFRMWDAGDADTVAGGNNNRATGGTSTVGGGLLNEATGTSSVISGGRANGVSGECSTIGGGEGNVVMGFSATIAGGGTTDTEANTEDITGNIAYDDYGTIGGGADNRAGSNDGATQDTTNAKFTTISGGKNNFATALSATVGGGQGNEASGEISTVGGGQGNQALAPYATIAGGGPSDPADPPNTNNRVTDSYGVIGGGGGNQAGDDAGSFEDAAYATICGGKDNSVTACYSSICGGLGNSVHGEYSFVGSGNTLTASGNYCVIGGGELNSAMDHVCTVAGGTFNRAGGQNVTDKNDAKGATVGGGEYNYAEGQYSTIPGGYSNAVYGDYSFAGGRSAEATGNGAFVWADSTDANFDVAISDCIAARVKGGVYFYTRGDLATGVYIAGGQGSWSTVSDRDKKENIAAVDGEDVLKKVCELPISTWNYAGSDPGVRHMGPMAQDLYAAFELGDSDKAIATVDADGVALAAIQGLHAKLKHKDEEIDALRAEVTQLKAAVDALLERVGNGPFSEATHE